MSSRIPIRIPIAFSRMCERVGMVPKQHQLDGIKWMVEKESGESGESGESEVGMGSVVDGGVRGGILADDMGMGKTLQVLGTMVMNPVPTLIVVPTMLVDQWAEIFRTYLGHNPLVYHGQKKRVVTEEEFSNAPVVITTYGTSVPNKRSSRINLLFSRKWGRIVYDEAHRLRNRSTAVYRSAESMNSDRIWLVTGTLVQNKISDLQTLFQLIGVPVPTHIHIKIAVQKHVLRRKKCITNGTNSTNTSTTSPESSRICVKWLHSQEKRVAQNTHVMTDKMSTDTIHLFGSKDMDALVDNVMRCGTGSVDMHVMSLIGEFVGQETCDKLPSVSRERHDRYCIAGKRM